MLVPVVSAGAFVDSRSCPLCPCDSPISLSLSLPPPPLPPLSPFLPLLSLSLCLCGGCGLVAGDSEWLGDCGPVSALRSHATCSTSQQTRNRPNRLRTARCFYLHISGTRTCASHTALSCS